MAGVTDTTDAPEVPARTAGTQSLVAIFLAAVVIGGGLAAAARVSALALLVGVAVAQALLALAWVFGTGMPGRRGAVVVAAMAAAGADVAASVWPHARLGPLLAVLGLAVPVMFVHQLLRGAARVQVVASMSAVSFLVLAEIALAALLQLRHEFGTELGGYVTELAVAAVAGAVAVGGLVDMMLPVPRFDPEVARGPLALVAAAGVGGALGYLVLHGRAGLLTERAAFVGAALGALAGLIAVGGAFVLHTTSTPEHPGRRLRPLLGALIPLATLAPVGFLLCLAIRS